MWYKTGRDGLGGAVMSSASFDEDSESKDQQFKLEIHSLKTTLEACLELF